MSTNYVPPSIINSGINYDGSILPSGFYGCYDNYEADELLLGGGDFNIIHQQYDYPSYFTQIAISYSSGQSLYSGNSGQLFYRKRINGLLSPWIQLSNQKLGFMNDIIFNEGLGECGFRFILGNNEHYLTVDASGSLEYNNSTIINESNLSTYVPTLTVDGNGGLYYNGSLIINQGNLSTYVPTLTVDGNGGLYYNGSLIINQGNLSASLPKSGPTTFGVIKTNYDASTKTLSIITEE